MDRTKRTAMTVDSTLLSHEWNADRSLPDNLRVLFRHARANEHMVFGSGEEDYQFQTAVVAALRATEDEEDRAWLLAQLQSIATISTVMQAGELGLTVDLRPEHIHRNPRTYTLLGLWHEVRDGEERV